jgi:hypothetical protein
MDKEPHRRYGRLPGPELQRMNTAARTDSGHPLLRRLETMTFKEMNQKLFDTDPRCYALELLDNGVLADHLLLCALKYMSHDDVREMLDMNELSPRFDDETEEEEETEQ